MTSFKMIATSLLLMSSLASAETLYSQGVRVGVINKVSYKGLINKRITGRLMLGKDSSVWEECSGSGSDRTCTTMNPWEFEMIPAVEGPIKAAAETQQAVVVRYNEYRYINDDAHIYNYTAVAVQKVDPSLAPTEACLNPAAKGHYSDGQLVGRIVKASYKGLFGGTKSWEVIIQEGESGNQFKEMSTTDENIFNCATKWALSGKPTRIAYHQKAMNFSLKQKSTYDISGIGPLKVSKQVGWN